jgi:S-(hydroxymethyl)glutathione dehydrogenase/alcohol dehydrogenase
LSTALGTIENEAKLKFGESIVIIGCGGVGLNLVNSASIGGAAVIVAVDIAPNKLESALQAGADYYVDLSDKNLENAFEKLPNTKSDVIIDTTGEIKLIRQAFNYLSENGRLILVSQPEIGAEVVIDSLSNMFGSEGKKIIFTQGGKFAPEKDILRYINLFQRKDLDVSFLSTKKFQLSEINKGIEVLKNGLTGRVIIEMSKGNL